MRRRSHPLRQVAEMARSVSSALELETVLAEVTSAVAALRPDAGSVLRLVDHDAGGYRLAASSGLSSPLKPVILFGEGLTHEVAERRQPVLVPDAAAHPKSLGSHWESTAGLGTYYGAPIQAGEVLLGVLNVGFPASAPPTRRELELIELLADHAAVAIRNARLFEESERRLRQAEALAELGRILAQGLEPKEVGQRITDLVRSVLEALHAAFHQLVPESGELAVLAVSGDAPREPAAGWTKALAICRLALETKAPVTTTDLLFDDRIPLTEEERAAAGEKGSRSALAVPLVVKGRPIGTLVVTDVRGRSFGAEETRLLEALADEAALALDNARLAAEAQRRQEEAENLAEVARTVTESLDVASVSERIVQSMLPLFRVPAAHLRILRPDRSLEAIGWAGANSEFQTGHVMAPGEGVIARSVSEGTVVRSPDVLSDPGATYAPETRRAIASAGFRALMSAPVRVKGTIIGVLSLTDQLGRTFSDQDAALLQTFADQSALALENARLYEALSLRASRLHTLARVNRLVSSSLDLGVVLGGIAQAATELMSAPIVSCWIADEARRTLTLRGFSDPEADGTFPVRTIRYDEGALGLIATYRKAVNVPDVFSAAQVVAPEWWRSHGISSFFGVPIVFQDTLLGILVLAGRTAFDFTPDDRDLLATFVAQAAVAISNATLYDQADRRRRDLATEATFLRAQSEVARVALTSLKADELLPSLLETMCRVQGYSYGHYWQVTEGSVEATIVASAGKDWARALGMRQSLDNPESLTAQAMRNGTPGFVNHLDETSPAIHALAKGLGAHALLALPVLDGRRNVVGALVFGDEEAERFSERDVTQGLVLANQVGQAIENSRLFSQVQRLEEQYRVVTDSLNDTIVTLDLEGRVTFANPAFEQLTGYAIDDMLGRRLSALTPGEASAATASVTFAPELVLARKDGTTVAVELSVADLVQEGQTVGRVAVARDVTERKRAEEALVARARQQAAVALLGQEALEGSDLADLMDEAVRLVAATLDAELCKVMELLPDGRSLLVVAGTGWKDGTVGGARIDAGGDSQAGYTLLAEGPVVVEDLRTETRFPGGSVLHDHRVASGMSVIVHGTERPFGVLSVHTTRPRAFTQDDVHFLQAVANVLAAAIHRRRAEAALREREQHLELVRRATNDAVWTWDVGAGTLTWNDAVRTLFGYEPEAVSNRQEWWLSRVHPEDQERVASGLRRTLEGPEPVWSDDYRFRRRDETYATVINRGYVVRDASGKPVRMVGAMTDISHRVHLEEQLRQSQKMEAVGRLAGGVAHDFNNLLTIIQGRTQLLLKRIRREDPIYRELDLIEATTGRAAELTRQLLAFSRKQMLAPKVVDLNAVVTEMNRMLARLIGEDIELVLAPAPHPALVRADPSQLEQVILNLAVNGRDAMPRGGRLCVTTGRSVIGESAAKHHPDVEPGRYVTLTVSDTGEGMDTETQARLFEPFYTTKVQGKGTGLGLSTVYGIVKQSGGHITIESSPGRGTSFTVYLPEIDGSVAPVAGRPAKTELPRGTETILLVEDEEGVRELAREVLEESGYTVIAARHGGEALEASRRRDGRIDLVVTDVVMPGMSGRQLAEQLTAARPGIKVLYMTGYTDDTVLTQGVSLAEVTLMQKPFTVEALLRQIRDLLDR